MGDITSAEMQLHFGGYRQEAVREPITITHAGQQSLVLVAAHEFARLKALDDRQALYAWELREDLAAALDAAISAPETHDFDGDTTA